MAEVTKKKRTRRGHRAYVTKTLVKVRELTRAETVDVVELTQLKLTLKEKTETISRLDELIIESLEAEEDIENEIEETSNVKAEIYGGIAAIDQTLQKVKSKNETYNVHERETTRPSLSHVKLPELKTKKFSGKVQEWMEFWDSYRSAIHENKNLSNVERFTYLRSVLEEPARAAIAGLSLTDANYKTAIELLERRFGSKVLVQRAHVNELLNVKSVFNAKDTKRLRQFFDVVEGNYRGLQAIGVDENLYTAIVVPSLLNKLPEVVRLTITRGKKYLEWTMEEFVEALLEEVELRENHSLAQEVNEDIIKEQSRRRFPATASTLFSSGKGKDGCAYCLGDHKHEECGKVTTVRERRAILRRYNRCFKCLRKGHIAKNCRLTFKCSACEGSHHVSVCDKMHEKESKSNTSNSNVVDIANTSNLHVSTTNRVALQTGQGIASGKTRERVRVLFDSGSQKTFVTAKLVNQAGLPEVRKEWLSICTFGGQEMRGGLKPVVGVNIQPLAGGEGVTLEAFVVPKISEIRNGRLDLVKCEYPHLKNLWLSDVCRSGDSLEIDVLIGADNLWTFQSGNVLRGAIGEPVAVETILGWVLSGPIRETPGDENTVEVHHVRTEKLCCRSLEKDVERMWDLETLGIKESDEVHEALLDKIKFNGERYSVKLPWKQGHEILPSNYVNSLTRMKGQIKRLSKERGLLEEYDQIIREQLDAGVVETVAELEKKENVHYLPHQAVIRRDAKTTKLRVVYDASSKAKGKGASLNECLHVGPSLTPMLFDILLRFRENRIVLVGDIEKAFLNIEVDKEDRDYLRFLWMRDISNSNSEVVVYRFCRVVFGLNSSPFLLNATLRHHIESYSDSDPEFVRKMLDSFYVDDLVTGGRTLRDVNELYEKANSRMKSGGFTLRKWLTNDVELRKRLAGSDDEVSTKSSGRVEDVETYAKSSLGVKDSLGEKVLGTNWNCVNDLITFDLRQLAQKAEGLNLTKRNLLSIIAGLFDPLGIVSPIIVPMKILFQELCAQEVKWDEELASESARKCTVWIDDLKDVKSITLDRCVYGSDCPSEEVLSCELHGFGDASAKAYCAAVYFVCRTVTTVRVCLLTAKTRIAPLKALTIPRLELMSAVVLAKLMKTVKTALEAQIGCVDTRYWLDSKTALYWIQNQGEWKQFVRHRVNEILKLSDKANWGHCSGLDNPADIGSRGILASKLAVSKLWWTGPQWLSANDKAWPNYEVEATTESKQEEKKSVVMLAGVKDSKLGLGELVSIEKYSSLDRLLKVTAWIKRFLSCLKNKVEGREMQSSERLTREELLDAEKCWIKAVQCELRQQDTFKQLERQLQLYNDEGVLKCKGRLAESDLPEETRNPAVLPRENRLAELIIRKSHERVHHSGTRSTLAEVRTRYWIPKGRQKVKAVIGKCTLCKRLESMPYKAPTPADLPSFRVKEAAVFSKTGVDFAGPLIVRGKANSHISKVYIALFSCCVSRAIHLDLVESLSAVEFVRCLRRFAARRGTPSLMVSDNAKTFKATAKALEKLYSSSEIQGFLEGNRIEWRFNLERAPWWGGFFERMVRCVKRCLKKVLGKASLTFAELLTVVVEIEGTLNSRPLTFAYDEVGYEVLTPSHLMFGRRLISMPDDIIADDSEDESDCGKRFKYLTKKKEHFWNRWRREYLVDLREFHKGKGGQGDIVEIGDVVVVHEDNVKRSNWKMAEVVELIKGRDEQVRGAKVRMIRNKKVVYLRRPIQKLYPCEVKNDVSEEEKAKEGNGEMAIGRPKRAAAIDAVWKTKNMVID